VVNQGAGVWAPESNRIIEVLSDWLDHPDEREKMAANSRRLARLDASHLIGHAIADQLGVTEGIIQRIPENDK
jgi:UDP-N-acetylglucosamine:LPS N-acetylglucosamine transferase